MKEKELEIVVTHLKEALKMLDTAGIEDERIMSRYVEYLVTLQLTKQGHETQIHSEREEKGADIFLPAENLRIEVKSGKYVYGSSVASFATGKQIVQDKFDFCVFVPYQKYKVKEFLVFNQEELSEVAEKPRKRFARFPNNSCLLIRCDSLKGLKNRLEPFDEEILKIEIDLHMNPEKFVDRWDKIISS